MSRPKLNTAADFKTYCRTYMEIGDHKVAITTKIKMEARALLASEKGKPADWRELHETARRLVRRDFFLGEVSDFYRDSKQFKKLRKKRIDTEFKGNKRIAGKVGVYKQTACLDKLVVAILLDDRSQNDFAKKLVKTEKLLKKVKPDELIRIIQKHLPRR